MNEKRDKFVRIAEARVSRAIKSIQVIGNLGNRSNYDYTEDDVRAIINALQAEVNELKAKFRPGKSGPTPEFRLPR